MADSGVFADTAPFSSHAICVFYLVLRALDTVEDDVTIPLDQKIPVLQNFHSYLYEPDWCFLDSQEKDRQVLEDFPTVRHTARRLLPGWAPARPLANRSCLCPRLALLRLGLTVSLLLL